MDQVVFVDSGAWFAAYVPSDPLHQAAAQFIGSGALRLVTSDYILDETLTLFRARGQAKRSLAVSAANLDEQLCRLLWVDKGDVLQAHAVYQRYADKAWSFTDCVTFAQMQRFGISKASTFDEHFRQFGFVTVLP